MQNRVFGMVLLSLFVSTSAFGAFLTVRQNGTGDYTTIEAALNAANTGDTIDVGPGIYAESLTISKSISLTSSGGPENTILSGNKTFRQIHVDGPYTVTIRNFTFSDGYGDNGSALLIWGSPTVTVEKCIFVNNHAFESNALHIRNHSTHVTVRNCEFRSNTAALTSAAVGIGRGGYALLEDCLFVDNVADQISGAVNCNEATLDVWGCLFLRNRSKNAGALVHWLSSGQVVNNTFVDNSGPLRGSVLATFGVVFRANIIVNEQSGPGLSDFDCLHTCNLYYNNARGAIESGSLADDEVVVDPEFCDLIGDVFTLCSSSPALLINNYCGLMGAYGLGCDGCGGVGIETASWGSVKALYR